jgi:hypothetical protein
MFEKILSLCGMVFIIITALFLVKCNKDLNADMKNLQERQLKESKEIHSLKCYSGTMLLLEDTSIGQVFEAGGYQWVSNTTGERRYWNGVCVVKYIGSKE